MFKPIGQINFTNQPGLNAADAVLAAESILFQPQIDLGMPKLKVGSELGSDVLSLQAVREKLSLLGKIYPKTTSEPVISLEQTQFEPVVIPFVNRKRQKTGFISAPDLELATNTNVGLGSENATKLSQATQALTLPEEEIKEEIITEKKLINPTSMEEIEVVDEQVEQITLKDVEDVEVTSQRIYEFGEAIEKAEQLNGEEIVKLLPDENPENQSQIVRGKGPDGSRVETLQEFAARKFTSREEAKKVAEALVLSKPPVKRALEGKVVPLEAVSRVLKYYLTRVIEILPTPAYEIITTRVIKKKVPVLTPFAPTPIFGGQDELKKNPAEANKEHSLDYFPPLVEVFQNLIGSQTSK